MAKRTTVRDLQKRKIDAKPITMVTAYDAFSARLSEEAGIDLLLVGDSVGTTVQGRDDTLAVSMDAMLYHVEIVARVSKRAFVVADMPFGSYQINDDEAVENAVSFLKAGAHAVKLEGGEAVAPLVARLVDAGVPVMGHLGYTPQSTHATSGPKVSKQQSILQHDCEALVAAGVFSIVLEMVASDVAKALTERVSIPTIGIGAGVHTDGQVLVFHDLLGFNPDFKPKFLKRYANLHDAAVEGLSEYRKQVESRAFPDDSHSY